MEFNHRANRHQAPAYLPQFSNYSHFTEQALRAGYLGPPGTDFKHPGALREAILIELEKEQINQDIIAIEIARKRSVEEEFRRGRQMAAERA